jgi:hypothetical protein
LTASAQRNWGESARSRVGNVWVAVLLAASGCTHDGPRQLPSPGTTAAFAVGHTSLGCADATAAGGGGTTGTPFQLHFDSVAGSPPLRARDVGLLLPADVDWYFRKEPLSLPAGAADVALSVNGPGQAVAWVAASVWTSGQT